MAVQILQRSNGVCLRWKLPDGGFRLVNLGSVKQDKAISIRDGLERFLIEPTADDWQTDILYSCLADGFSKSEAERILTIYLAVEKRHGDENPPPENPKVTHLKQNFGKVFSKAVSITGKTEEEIAEVVFDHAETEFEIEDVLAKIIDPTTK